ncbi:MAG TPA: DUF948 domain-containing protein [Leptolyngbyaceae cyanobacterium M33_DOE_097]|uniref:DUF948 domain-containing protein n=1 Tax=Oscillatoriales cyanobacterium SpSt-418 TaxID=2282169 RepID=A0A7C3KF28_9CYAN|nr:DUF948 domain-containing protein [Leptolyngbyaceae cyanobacterium M33_DOE_097]
MTDPLFWLVLSFLFVTISLTLVLAVAIPALREVARAARSAEKLFDTLARDFPPTLESIRMTGREISDLTDDMSQGVQSAGQVVKQVDDSLATVRKQANKVQHGTRSVMVGLKAAWKSFTKPAKPPTARRSPDRLPASVRPEINLPETSRHLSEDYAYTADEVAQANEEYIDNRHPFITNAEEDENPYPAANRGGDERSL